MKQIICLVVLLVFMAIHKPVMGEASDLQGQSKQTISKGQMTTLLNMAYWLTTGQVNDVTNIVTELVTIHSILNERAISNVNSFIAGTNSEANMIVKFLDVGQGDAIYIQYPNGKTALVDAGRNDTVIDAALKAEHITRIDTFIATHPDADHIGGAAHVIENYGVTKVIDGGQTGATQSYFNYIEAVNGSDVQFEITNIGNNLSDDINVTAKVLFVDREASELNDGSIVLLLSYGETDILLTGDAEIKVEEYLLKNYNLDVEILKVAHHGANTGTSNRFIEAVSPTEAILQYGYNLFGLPHPQVVNDLISEGATIYSTHDRGTITVNTDGKSYSVNTKYVQRKRNNNQTSNELRITTKEVNEEIVTIKNVGSTSVDMTGWILLSVKGHQTFTFPDGFIIHPEQSVNLSSGPNAIENPPHNLKWTESYIWNTNGDTAKLYDPFGQLIHQL